MRLDAVVSGRDAVVPVAVHLRRIRPEPTHVVRGGYRHGAGGYRDHRSKRDAADDRSVVWTRHPSANRPASHNVHIGAPVDIDIGTSVDIDVGVSPGTDIAAVHAAAGSCNIASAATSSCGAAPSSASAPGGANIDDRVVGRGADVLGEGHRHAMPDGAGRDDSSKQRHAQKPNYFHLPMLPLQA